MNDSGRSNRGASDEVFFDRLVDGELTPDEYRALVASLDDEPGGWRRCALAFLEAQALAAELGQVRRALDLREEGGQRSLPTRRWRWSDARSLLAVAASFVAAFALGVASPRFFQRGEQDQPLAGNHMLPRMAQLEPEQSAGDEVRHQVLRPVGNVRLVMDGAGDEWSQSREVPVYDMGQDFEWFLNQEGPALGPELVELLQQRGHEVVRHSEYLPAQLDDGRHVIVPVERYLITPVGSGGY